MSRSGSAQELRSFLAPRCAELDSALEMVLAGGGVICKVAPESYPWGVSGVSFNHINTPIEKGEGSESIVFKMNEVLFAHGFSHGAILDDLLERWSESRGWGDGLGRPYVYSNYFLWRVWERFLEPNRPNESLVYYTDTVGINPLHCINFRGDFRDVPVGEDDLIAFADEVFPRRSDGWMKVFCSVTFIGLTAEQIYASRLAVANALGAAVDEFGWEIWEMFRDLIPTGPVGGPSWSTFADLCDSVVGALAV